MEGILGEVQGKLNCPKCVLRSATQDTDPMLDFKGRGMGTLLHVHVCCQYHRAGCTTSNRPTSTAFLFGHRLFTGSAKLTKSCAEPLQSRVA